MVWMECSSCPCYLLRNEKTVQSETRKNWKIRINWREHIFLLCLATATSAAATPYHDLSLFHPFISYEIYIFRVYFIVHTCMWNFIVGGSGDKVRCTFLTLSTNWLNNHSVRISLHWGCHITKCFTLLLNGLKRLRSIFNYFNCSLKEINWKKPMSCPKLSKTCEKTHRSKQSYSLTVVIDFNYTARQIWFFVFFSIGHKQAARTMSGFGAANDKSRTWWTLWPLQFMADRLKWFFPFWLNGHWLNIYRNRLRFIYDERTKKKCHLAVRWFEVLTCVCTTYT